MKFFSDSWEVEKSRFLKKTVLPSSTSLFRSVSELSPFQDLFFCLSLSSPNSSSSSSSSPSLSASSSSSSSISSSSPFSPSSVSSSSSLLAPCACTSSILESPSILFSEVDGGFPFVVSFLEVSSVDVWEAYWFLGMAQSTAIGLPAKKYWNKFGWVVYYTAALYLEKVLRYTPLCLLQHREQFCIVQMHSQQGCHLVFSAIWRLRLLHDVQTNFLQLLLLPLGKTISRLHDKLYFTLFLSICTLNERFRTIILAFLLCLDFGPRPLGLSLLVLATLDWLSGSISRNPRVCCQIYPDSLIIRLLY